MVFDVMYVLGDAVSLDKMPAAIPIRLVMGSPVYGHGAAEWDTPEAKFSNEQLTSIVQTVTSKSNALRITFAFLMPLQMCYEMATHMTTLCSGGSEVVVVHFPNSPPAHGTFYVNRCMMN